MGRVCIKFFFSLCYQLTDTRFCVGGKSGGEEISCRLAPNVDGASGVCGLVDGSS